MNKTKETISIIVPLYNAEKYLKRCISSILKSTYKELELILVDDGSTDSSPRICDEYAHYDRRVIVIHKKNAGAELARADGVARCIGKYIMFVDADDYITDDIIEHGIHAMTDNEADIVCFNYHRGNEYQCFNILKEECIEARSALQNLLIGNKMDGNLWCKIFQTKFVKAQNVIFRDKRNCDFLTTVEIFENAKKIYLLPECGYIYAITEGSLTNRNTCHDREEEYVEEAEKFHKEFCIKYPDIQFASEYNFLMALLFVAIKMEKDKNINKENKRYKIIHNKLKLNMGRYMRNPYISLNNRLQVILCRFCVFSKVWAIYVIYKRAKCKRTIYI